MAKKMDEAKNSGGSPTAFDEYTALGFGAPFKSDTLNSPGISAKPGILYTPKKQSNTKFKLCNKERQFENDFHSYYQVHVRIQCQLVNKPFLRV